MEMSEVNGRRKAEVRKKRKEKMMAWEAKRGGTRGMCSFPTLYPRFSFTSSEIGTLGW